MGLAATCSDGVAKHSAYGRSSATGRFIASASFDFAKDLEHHGRINFVDRMVTQDRIRAIIDATPSGHMTYLVSEHGKPYTAPSFGNKFRDWCDQAGLRHCSAHGIRKFNATAAAENGATAHQLMAMFGWDSIQQAEHYTRKASQRKLATGAMHLLTRENERAT